MRLRKNVQQKQLVEIKPRLIRLQGNNENPHNNWARELELF